MVEWHVVKARPRPSSLLLVLESIGSSARFFEDDGRVGGRGRSEKYGSDLLNHVPIKNHSTDSREAVFRSLRLCVNHFPVAGSF